MREILFKAKRLDNGEWVQGWPCMDVMHEHANITYHLGGHPVHIAVDPETVCQYTGLTDKNGVKIFEGDRCVFFADTDPGSYREETEETNVVFWDADDGQWSVKELEHGVTDSLDWFFSENCTVVGNIHDNA